MSTSMNIGSYYNDAAIYAAAQKGMDEIREIERRGTSKAETLEDIRETKGKSYRTADLIKLMEKYDPDAYAEYSKFGKTADGAYSRAGLSYLSGWLDKIKKGFKDGTVTADGIVKGGKAEKNPGISAANEEKLSKKAQDFLAKLREKYGDYDFFVADNRGDFAKLAKAGSKEFSVIISSRELERMASDEKYADEKMKSVETAVRMSKKISEQLSASSSGKENGSGSVINRLTIEIKDGGKMNIMAELEKSSDKQKERIDKSRAKKAEDKKAQAKKAEEKRRDKADKAHRDGRPGKTNPYEREDRDSVKRTTVEASTPEELLEKIQKLDWSKVTDSYSGDKFNFTA